MKKIKLELTEEQVIEISLHLLNSSAEKVPQLTEDILHQCVEQNGSDSLLDYVRDAYNNQNRQ